MSPDQTAVEALSPCPWCKAVPSVIWDHTGPMNAVAIECENVDGCVVLPRFTVDIHDDGEATKAEAIHRWNAWNCLSTLPGPEGNSSLPEPFGYALTPHPDFPGAEIATPCLPRLQWTGRFSVHDPDPSDDHSAIYLVCPGGLMVNFSCDPTPSLDVARVSWVAQTLNAALSPQTAGAGDLERRIELNMAQPAFAALAVNLPQLRDRADFAFLPVTIDGPSGVDGWRVLRPDGHESLISAIDYAALIRPTPLPVGEDLRERVAEIARAKIYRTAHNGPHDLCGQIADAILALVSLDQWRPIDDEALRAMIRSKVGDGSIAAWSRDHGLHDEQVGIFLRGTRPAEPKLLAALGYERIVTYRALPSTGVE